MSLYDRSAPKRAATQVEQVGMRPAVLRFRLQCTLRCAIGPEIRVVVVGERPVPLDEPVFDMDGVQVVMSPLEIASIPKRGLGPAVASLRDGREQIVAALDLLSTGV